MTNISLIELFLQQFDQAHSFNRYDTIVRLLAIENYYGLNNCGWNLYCKMQDSRKFKGYSIESKENFIKLIKSWEENGYDVNSSIIVNSKIKLWDGSHRLALALFHNIKKLSLSINDISDTHFYGIEWFYENDFTLKEINIIESRLEKLLKEYNKGVYISCILWAPMAEYFEEVTEKINSIFPVSNVKDISFSNDTYTRMVRGIYKIDDIADWKIEKKIEYMQNYPLKKIRFLNIFVEYPIFRFKQSNFNTILVQGEILKRIFRNCYKDKINNYFYDILVHTADNTVQTEYINKLYNVDLKLEKYFNIIKNYDYMIIKYETENMTKDFPKTFPFSKDIDILCNKKDFSILVKKTEEFLKNILLDNYHINNIKIDDYHTKVRVELNGFLIYSFDISSYYYGLNETFLNTSLKRKEHNNICFIPKIEDELIFRLVEYLKFPTKKQHYEYILNNIKFFEYNKTKLFLTDYFYKLYKQKLADNLQGAK